MKKFNFISKNIFKYKNIITGFANPNLVKLGFFLGVRNKFYGYEPFKINLSSPYYIKNIFFNNIFFIKKYIFRKQKNIYKYKQINIVPLHKNFFSKIS